MAEVQGGRLDLRPIVSHRLPLEEATKGYELFDTKQATKVLPGAVIVPVSVAP